MKRDERLLRKIGNDFGNDRKLDRRDKTLQSAVDREKPTTMIRYDVSAFSNVL